MIDLLVVDDNPVVRAAVHGFLAGQDEIRVVGEAADGREALRLAHRLRPAVTLLDYRMPVADGLSVIATLAEHTRVLVLTSDTGAEIVAGMLRGGARGYLVWGQFEPPDLLRAIREVAAGSSWLSPVAASVAATAFREQGARERAAREQEARQASARQRHGISAREEEVLDLLGLGLSNASIAHRLGLTEKTVKNHLNHIFAKLGVSNRTEAVVRWRG
ncbi:response regulator [Actinoplanes friuliensis]|jgi:DNA-binding NarL/FixJ family response regulator|uniref:LuxR family transcriptional regulator n=1 Tax=Actinoplanes friuliensis DSM 7358 TaxID=1246995 RepID=U5W9P4_9ACTN|nr:response regulator transcription factor [Actinoplanes friuliensis]AGZ45928.1 LuxR family transcriptional regulator [Actinoplanes friuliensis DSM 7358]